MRDKTVTGMINELDRKEILRDAIAMAAINGILAAPTDTLQPYRIQAKEAGIDVIRYISETAYEFADAMMEARK